MFNRKVCCLILIVPLVSSCSAKKEEAASEEHIVTVDVAPVLASPISQKVVADALLYPLQQWSSTPKISAPVKKFYVDRGSHVKAGQLLAELENQDLTGAQLRSQGGYEQADATYQMQLQKVDQDLKLAKQTLDSQQKLYDSRVALYKEGAVSAKDVDDA